MVGVEVEHIKISQIFYLIQILLFLLKIGDFKEIDEFDEVSCADCANKHKGF